MAGHSKWANIKHKKAAVDAKRGKAFTKVVKFIQAAVKKGGGVGDPDMNPALRLAVEKARAVNMPKDNIDRAIKKATGDGDGVQFEELIYEGYGQGGVAIFVEALTDNRNRTTPEVRKIFEKAGGNLGEMGCVAWMFKLHGSIELETAGKTEDEWMEIVLESGAEDLEMDEEVVEIRTSPEQLTAVMDALREQGFDPKGDIVNVADPMMKVDFETAKKVLNLMDAIEDHEDVQSVTSSMELTDEIKEKLEAEE
jgi:YebC/PmpR family DNA-binding regulatory protein